MTASNVTIRDLGQGVTIFSVPFSRPPGLPIGGRSTAFKQENGQLLICASHPLCDKTKAKIDELTSSKVSHIVCLDSEHTMNIGDYHRAYPDAKVIGVEPNVDKLKDVKFAGVFGRDENPLADAPEFLSEYFVSFGNKDVVIYHKPSKTMVEADLLYNMPLEAEQKTKALFPSFMINKLQPDSWLHRKAMDAVITDKAAFATSAKRVSSWDIQRLIPCHGKVLDGADAAKAWQTLYGRYLGGAGLQK